MIPIDHVVLIHKHLTGRINSDEQQELDEWLASDPSNRKEFDDIALIWKGAEVEGEEDISDREFDELLEELVRRVRTPGNLIPDRSASRQSGRVKNVVMAVLACTTLFLIVFILQKEGEEGVVRITSFNAPHQTLFLPDSSRVLLNDSSTVSVAMHRDHRLALVRGEVLFDVKSDERPFLIEVGDLTLTVVGTSLIARCYPGNPGEVLVVTGQVKAASGEQSVMVCAGERAWFDMTAGLIKSPIEDINFNSWYTDHLVFDKSPLSDVLPALEKQYKVRFVVQAEAVLDCRFTGKFHSAPLEEILQTLAFSLKIVFSEKPGNTYVVSGSGCG